MIVQVYIMIVQLVLVIMEQLINVHHMKHHSLFLVSHILLINTHQHILVVLHIIMLFQLKLMMQIIIKIIITQKYRYTLVIWDNHLKIDLYLVKEKVLQI